MEIYLSFEDFKVKNVIHLLVEMDKLISIQKQYTYRQLLKNADPLATSPIFLEVQIEKLILHLLRVQTKNKREPTH